MSMLTNPNAVFGQTNDGQEWQVTAPFHNSSTTVAIVAGDAVALVWDETARTMKVEAWDTDAAGQSASIGIGVALDDIPVSPGKAGRVVVFGFAMVNIGAGAAAEGQVAVGSTTKGQVTAATADATTVAGTVLGVFLGDEDGTTNKAPLWVSPR